MGENLTEMQRRFCDYYIENPNATQAAIKAGYSENSAHVIGNENLTKPAIASYIKARNDMLESVRIADMREVKEFWTDILRDNFESLDERLKASDYLAKSCGGYRDIRLNEARIKQIEANAEYTREKTKLLKGDEKDTSILEALVRLDGKG